MSEEINFDDLEYRYKDPIANIDIKEKYQNLIKFLDDIRKKHQD